MPGPETIGDWSVTQLVRFLEDTLRQNPPSRIPALTCDDVTINETLTVQDKIVFTQRQSTVGGAGGATALPATPLGYFIVQDFTGLSRAIPYYNVN